MVQRADLSCLLLGREERQYSGARSEIKHRIFRADMFPDCLAVMIDPDGISEHFFVLVQISKLLLVIHVVDQRAKFRS